MIFKTDGSFHFLIRRDVGVVDHRVISLGGNAKWESVIVFENQSSVPNREVNFSLLVSHLLLF